MLFKNLVVFLLLFDADSEGTVHGTLPITVYMSAFKCSRISCDMLRLALHLTKLH